MVSPLEVIGALFALYLVYRLRRAWRLRGAYYLNDALKAEMLKYRRIDRNGCWIWTGWVGKNGRGRVKIVNRYMNTHRLAYLLWNGPIPRGKEVSHTCHVKLCFNPTHLVAETHAENMARGARDGRFKRRRKPLPPTE